MSSNNFCIAGAYAHGFLLNFDKDNKMWIFQIRPKVGDCEELKTKHEIQVTSNLIIDTPVWFISIITLPEC